MKMLKSGHFIYQNSKILILDPDIFRTRENFATKTCRDAFSFLEKLILKYIDNLISDVQCLKKQKKQDPLYEAK